MKTVKWGIIGCGNVTELKSGPAFNKIKDSQIISVMRRDAEKLKDYAKRHKISKYTTDPSEIINDSAINAIYIATPPSSHAEYAIMGAQAGKHVYVEKPMAISSAACQMMINECKKNNVKLFVAYYRRALPYFLKIKRLIDKGEIGKPLAINIKLHKAAKKEDMDSKNLPWRVVPEIGGAGYFYDLASHQLDIFDYIFGKIISATGIAVNQAGLYPAVDNISGSFEFKSGVTGTGSWCFIVSEKHETDFFEIMGSEGRITASTFDRKPIVLENSRGRSVFKPKWPKHIQQPLIKTIVQELIGQGECPSTGETAVRTNKAMELILGGRM